ncbi:ras-related protein R-Ras precursor [Reticulomyxa filosa]|uniref:Ras-related protein R-Ras n=1 Tax=Reticulomyxa filosa TaxID=46433 RepID=X6MBZ3_RETFI|nr:ras-related protein R-Ras precursor [Reticulomyxa filosa]|eukprot:ETO11359.1 ras-related protein R-Ras precursor [Reticulomyxa filosa]
MTKEGAEKEYKMVVMGGGRFFVLEKKKKYKTKNTGGVGKSALTIRLISGNFLDEYDPTQNFKQNQEIFFFYVKPKKKKEMSCLGGVEIDGIPATLDILDTAGQDEFAAMRDLWIREAKGFLLVYAITWSSSFNQVQEMFQKIHRIKEEELNQIAIVLVGTFFFLKNFCVRKRGFFFYNPFFFNPFFIFLIKNLKRNKCDLADSRTVSMEQGQNLVDQWKKEGVSAAFFEASAKAQINNEECYFEIVRQLRRKENIVGPGDDTGKSGGNSCACTML